MPFNITPSLGINLDYVGGLPHYDANQAAPSPKLGSKVVGDDGHDYVFVKASAAVAASTAVTITEPAFTAAGGAGGFTTPATAVPINQYFWARKTAL